MENQLLNIIQTQGVLIMTLKHNVDYMEAYVDFRHKELKNINHLLRLYHLVQNDSVLILYKLIKNDESYSLDNLKALLFSNKLIDKTDNFLKAVSISKKIKKKYEQLNIKDIRDTHVGHFDYRRSEHYIKAIEFKLLSDYLQDYFWNIESLFGEERTDVDRFSYKSLIPILDLEIKNYEKNN
ncbi:hypothetical protein [Psychroflexus sp. ALD_RP9]|uniref:hypothetical protein n=1 Tax=Psychroflexus sp. ALD_RP9 TaxID=2777186 RepID=UPI001A8C6CE3|nr:hypothetical protein [Psychroflexus sp. ALD_RP9]QSS96915.1 hypothetical protein IMZ30_10765 [Psychroflexus sp. ALD_RP9]